MRAFTVILCAMICIGYDLVEAKAINDTTLHPQGRKEGCDAIVDSCGSKGACCDTHDECWRRHNCSFASWGLVGKYRKIFVLRACSPLIDVILFFL